MRHARRDRRLSRPSEHRKALVIGLAKAVLQRGRLRTTVARAKEAQRLVDRLISLGKEGSVHSRRRADRLLQDRELVKQLFAEVAPRFLDCQGGYTRILKLPPRVGDGASQALFELTRVPAQAPKAPPKAKAAHVAPPQAPAAKEAPAEAAPKKPKRFLEGLRDLFRAKKAGPPS
jgi:large subunit ribosomal protein L17